MKIIEVKHQNAAIIIAGLVREGISFEARDRGDCIVITCTGGY